MAATHGLASILQNQESRPVAQRADGSAAVLGIGTANPANSLRQEEYADWYFGVTKNEHLTTLKNKMNGICEKSGIKKRHFHYTAQTIADHPEFLDGAAPSLDSRLGITQDAVPELAAAAAARAIADWGRPASDITHLVVTTNSSANAPGADLRLAALLGLSPTVQRTLLYLHGCFGGCSALRVAKDLAENNRGARVLVASSEVTKVLCFRATDEDHMDALVARALVGDSAGATIMGAGDLTPVERPVFYMVSVSQATLPGTEHALSIELGTSRLELDMSAEVPSLLRGTIKECLAETLAPLGLPVPGAGWNGLFWAVHPGGRAILDSCETALTLDAGKLAASRHVLSEFGMVSATIFFVLEEIRRRRQDDDGDCEWGVMLGIGPGITVEMMVLQAAGLGRKC